MTDGSRIHYMYRLQRAKTGKEARAFGSLCVVMEGTVYILL